MNIIIAAVGRLRSGPEQALIDSYIKRLPWSVEVREIEARAKNNPPAQAKQESDGLLAAIPAGAKILCLDSRGKGYDSEQFASRLGRWRDEGERTLVVVIGGADGLSEEVINNAHLVLSFGSVTWPHMLVRVLLTEQLYRAHCILTGHPYHRGH
jgi:23S rRNA (pseudouridine1915-N3)-methyltransferase